MVDTVTFQQPETSSVAPASQPQEQVQQQQQQGAQPATTERPAWLPENMKSGEDLAKAFADTKAELTRVQQELAKIKKQPAQPQPNEQRPESGNNERPLAEGKQLEIDNDEAKTAEQKLASMDFSSYQQEFAQTGDVSPESRAKIADQLRSIFGDDAEGVVNDYIEGAKVRVANYNNQIKAIAGGDEGYAQMVAWAKDNLTAEEKATFNRAVNSGDYHAASFAVHGLKAKYEAANGRSPNLVMGDSLPNVGGFRSLYEMKEAMADPRYQKDPDYRAQVIARAARSNI